MLPLAQASQPHFEVERIPTAYGVSGSCAIQIWGRRLGELRHAADILVGIAGIKGEFTPSVLDADIPALLRKGAMEASGGQLEPPRDIWALQKRGGGYTPTREPDRAVNPECVLLLS